VKITTHIFVLLFSLAIVTANACPSQDCVRVGSWNIAWLGSDKRQQASDDKTIEAMAVLIANELSVDLIALQEINTAMEGNIRGEHYSLAPYRKLHAALTRLGYTVQAGNSGYAQHIVLAWRAPVKALVLPHELAVPAEYTINDFCRSKNLRIPLAGYFRSGEFDFWAVGLHNKANTGPAACVNAVRKQQTEALVKTFPALIKKDRDIVLLGDFNTSAKNDSLSALYGAGFRSLTDKDHRHPASNKNSYHSANSKSDSSGSLIDHIMIRPADTQEWRPASTMIYQPSNSREFAQRFSDHLPLWADFSTRRDDD
jgi:endonuclease/exonuclease/phosphatase family metal-dependent hydrolase